MCIPMLDLVPPQPAKLLEAAASIERARANGPVLVCCALGYSRSAATVATWLLASNGHSTVGQALATVREARPRIVIDGATRDAIASAAEVGA
jgi:protein-tyrosine phosphatase